jgi:signal transduction histidine kinase/ActR/RegA family two-component response regulator
MVAAACLAAFLPVQAPLRLLLFPVLTLVAFRLGPRGAAASALVVGALCSTLAMTGWSIPGLTSASVTQKAHNLQLLVAVAFLTSLSTALAVADQKRLKRLWASRTRVARAAESRALAADKAKADFLATISHEIRTPMNAIIGFTEVLLRREDLSEPARRQLTLIDRAGASLLTVANDILDFSKLETGDVKFMPQPTTARTIAQDALAIVAEAARRKGLNLQLGLAGPAETPVLADGLRLRQVLLNLLSNAIQFTEAGRVRLDVKAAEAGEAMTLRFTVTDSGIGIAPDKLAALFKRLGQPDGAGRRDRTGTGLGLSICKGLIDGMGGRIGVDSAEGLGSVFWIELTAALAERSAVEASAVDGPRPARILLVDDHPMNLELGAAVLTLLGCEVVRAENGDQAVAAARDAECDLVLMDVHMPTVDGLEATRRIRALAGPAAGLAIIGMSADVTPEMDAACLAAGMDETVGKPIQMEALRQVLAKWLGAAAAVRAA